MSSSKNPLKSIRSRLLNVVGVTAGVGMASLAGTSQVFAGLYLQEGTPTAQPAMVYSPTLQMMVKPDSEEPAFRFSRALLSGPANGEYRDAPLITCPGDPSCPEPAPPPSHTVTPNDDPDGAGPTADSD